MFPPKVFFCMFAVMLRMCLTLILLNWRYLLKVNVWGFFYIFEYKSSSGIFKTNAKFDSCIAGKYTVWLFTHVCLRLMGERPGLWFWNLDSLWCSQCWVLNFLGISEGGCTSDFSVCDQVLALDMVRPLALGCVNFSVFQTVLWYLFESTSQWCSDCGPLFGFACNSARLS